MIHKIFGTPLNGDERVAICSSENIPQTALLFDRIIIIHSMPDATLGIPPEVGLAIPEPDKEAEASSVISIMKARANGSLNTVTLQEIVLKTYSKAYERHLGLGVIPIFSHRTAYQQSYPSGEAIGYQAALENIPIVSGKSLDWKKVFEFRRDKDATRKYRDMYLWLKYGLEAKSLKDAKEIISQKIDDYSFALEKHEIETYIGVLEHLLAWDKAAVFTALTSAVGYLEGPIWAALTGSFLIGASVLASVQRRQLEAEALRHSEGREVAILVEARKRFSKQAG